MLNKMKKALRGILVGRESAQSEMEHLISQDLRIGKNLRKNMYPRCSRFPFIKDPSQNGWKCLRKKKTP